MSNNIGCYGGEGLDVEYDGENFIEKIIRIVKHIVARIIYEINIIIEDIKYDLEHK